MMQQFGRQILISFPLEENYDLLVFTKLLACLTFSHQHLLLNLTVHKCGLLNIRALYLYLALLSKNKFLKSKSSLSEMMRAEYRSEESRPVL
jgi:hypothetical protein